MWEIFQHLKEKEENLFRKILFAFLGKTINFSVERILREKERNRSVIRSIQNFQLFCGKLKNFLTISVDVRLMNGRKVEQLSVKLR